MIRLNEFIARSREAHGDKYDYSNVNFGKITDKVVIICPIHGEFIQEARQHYRGQGCPKCGVEKRSASKTYSTDEFIKKAIEVHGDVYDFSHVEYVGTNVPIKLHCEEHGEFEITPHNLLAGRGCPMCGNSRKGKGRKKKTDSLVKQTKAENKITTNTQQKQTNDSVSIKDLYSFIVGIVDEKYVVFDSFGNILVKNKNVAFEIDYLNVNNEKNIPNKNYHIKRTYEYENNGVKLIHIFDDEWLNKNEICKSRIKNILGLTDNRIFARKCNMLEVDNDIAKNFMNTNHIQGWVTSKYCYGLYYQNELVSLMTFGQMRKNLGRKNVEGKYELLRFANKNGLTVVGGASRLLKHFIKTVRPDSIITYADRRWSVGNMYEQIGFVFKHMSQPNYFYIVDGKRRNRFAFRKDILVSKYGCSKDDSEHNFCFNKGWYRIYDCGTKVFELNLNQNENN